MHVVSLSLDPHILDASSVVARRNCRYGMVLSSFTILVPAAADASVQLSDTVTVHGVGGTKLVQIVKLYRHLVRLIKAGQCDVISSQDTYFLALLGYVVARRYHRGLEVQVLGVEKLNWFRKRLAQFTMRRAGSIRILSKRLWRRMETEFGVVSDRMRLVPIYVDVSSLGFGTATAASPEFAAMRQQFTERYKGRKNILTVCRLVPIKNIPLQLAALQRVITTVPDALLHIVGDGPDRASLEAAVASAGLENHVVFHGHQTGASLSAYFVEADAFVLSSDAEGWGMVIIEAALASLPVVMTDVGCAGEVIINGESGLVVPVGDAAALAAALERMLTDDTLAAACRTMALEHVKALPSFEELLVHYKMSWQQAQTNSY